MKTYAAITDAEAKGLQDGTITLLVIPFEKQPLFYGEPGDLYSFRADLAGGSRECRTFKSHKYPRSGLHNFPVSSPYAPGDEIEVKKTGTCLLCESVAAKQVQSIITCASEIMATGVIYDADAPMIGPCEGDAGDLIEQFSAEWDRRHPSTPWAANPWVWFCHFRKKGD